MSQMVRVKPETPIYGGLQGTVVGRGSSDEMLHVKFRHPAPGQPIMDYLSRDELEFVDEGA